MKAMVRRIRRVVFPLSLLAGLGGVYLYNENVIVPQRETAFGQRAFSALGLMGDQIQSRQEVFAEVLKTQAERSKNHLWQLLKRNKADWYEEWAASRTREFWLVKGFKHVPCPEEFEQLQELRETEKQPGGSDGVAILSIVTKAEGVMLRLSYTKDEIPVCGESRVQDTIAPSATDVPGELFEDIYVARSDGQVIFQRSPGPMRLGNLQALLKRLPGAEEKPSRAEGTASQDPAAGGPPSQESWQKVRDASTLMRVELGGTRYLAFLQPVRLRIQEDSPSRETAGARLVVCGLLPENSFRQRSVGTPSPRNLWLGLAAAVIILLTYPLLKLKLMNDMERLKRWEGVVLAIAIFAGTFPFAPVIQHVLAFYSLQSTQERLEAIALQIDLNLASEVSSALETLDRLRSTSAYQKKLVAIRKEEHAAPVKPGAIGQEGPAGPAAPSPCWQADEASAPKKMESITNVLGEQGLMNPPQKLEPASMELAFWGDRNGDQRLKIAPYPVTTGPTSLREYSFFRQVLCGPLWHLKGRAPANPQGVNEAATHKELEFYVASLYSPNTAEYLPVIARKAADPPLAVEAIAMRLTSVMQPVLPPSYGFAIIDARGEVVFHSNISRNLRENLYRAVESAGQMEGAVKAKGDSGILELTYQGIPHAFHVTRLPSLVGSPWRLIVFKDMRSRNAMLKETLLLFLTMTLCLWLAGGILWGFVSWAAGLRLCVLQDVFWPDRERSHEYFWLCGELLLTLVLFLAYVMLTNKADGWIASSLIFPFLAAEMILFRFAANIGKVVLRTSGAFVLLFLAAHTFWNGWDWRGMIALAAVTVLWSLSPIRPKKEKTQVVQAMNRLDSPAFPATYFLCGFCLFVLAGIVPGNLLFRLSLDVEQTLSGKQALLQVASDLSLREQRIRTRLDGMAWPSPPPNLHADVLKAQLENCWGRYEALLWRRHAGDSTVCRPSSPGTEPDVLLSSNPILATMARTKAAIPYPQAASTRALASASRHEGMGKQDWTRDADGYVWHVSSSLRAETREAHPSGMESLAVSALAAIVLGVILWNTLYWTYSYPPETESHHDGAHHLLLLARPNSGAAHRVLASRDPATVIDIRRELARGRWLPSVEIPEGQRIILDNFDWGDAPRRWSAEKLALLERLVFVMNKDVVVICCSDPLLHLEEEARVILGSKSEETQRPPAEVERWERVLQEFERQYDREGWAPAHEHEARLIWDLSSKREKLVLLNVYEDGWTNRKNGTATRHLLAKGLIEQGRVWKISSPVLRRFLRTATRGERAFLKDLGTAGGWSGSRQTIVIAGVLMLAAVGYLNNEIPAWLLGLMGAIPTVFRLFASRAAATDGGGSQTA